MDSDEPKAPTPVARQLTRRSSGQISLLEISKLNKALKQAILQFNEELVEYSNEFDTEEDLIGASEYLLSQMTETFKQQIQVNDEKVVKDFVDKLEKKANDILEQFISKMREKALFQLNMKDKSDQVPLEEADSFYQTESEISVEDKDVSQKELDKLNLDDTISTLSSDAGIAELNLGEEYLNHIKIYRNRLKTSIKYSMDELSITKKHQELRRQMIMQFLKTDPGADVQQFGQYLDQCFNEFRTRLLNKQTKLKNCFEECVRVYNQGMNELLKEGRHYSERNLKERHNEVKQKSINCLKQNIEEKSQNRTDFYDLEEDLTRKVNEDFQKYTLKNESARCKAEIELESKIKLYSEQYEKEIFTLIYLVDSKDELIEKNDKIKDETAEKFLDEFNLNDEDIRESYLDKLNASFSKSFERSDQILELNLQKKSLEKQNLIKRIRDSYKQKMEEKFKIKRFYFKNNFLDHNYSIITELSAQHNVDQEFVYDSVDDIFTEFNELNARNTPKVPAIGIDLGTHNSCAAYFTPEHQSVVILNEMGKDVTPSVVSFRKNNEVVVGQVAALEQHIHPKNTIHSVKRLIGQTFTDLNRNKYIKSFVGNLGYNLENVNDQPTISIEPIPNVKEKYLAQEVSAKVLQNLRQAAQKYLEGFDVKKVVITVPAYFNESQKAATKEAGRMAGLEVLGILTEPTAAAIVFKTERNKDMQEKTILIFDFGGGTLDVAIVRLEKGEIITQAIKGDNYLGGNDIDNNLIEYCLAEFEKQTKVKHNKDTLPVHRLRQACELAKIRLTAAQSTSINVNNFDQDNDLNLELTRKMFNEINKDIFDRAISLVKSALKDAKIKEKEIDDIVLVGGSTRIPKIQGMLSKLFNNRPLNHTINPDHSVAIGAAIHAAILNGQSAQERLFQFTDVNPMSLGLEKVNKDMVVLIPRNTKLPTKMTKSFATNEENQKSVEIKVYEGEEKVASRNHLLGKFILDGLPPGKKGKVKIYVTFEIKKDGILNVTAKCDNVQGNLDIKEHRSRLTEEELQELVAKNKYDYLDNDGGDKQGETENINGEIQMSIIKKPEVVTEKKMTTLL